MLDIRTIIERIPHLQLDIDIDIEKIQTEYKNHVKDENYVEWNDVISEKLNWKLNAQVQGILDYSIDPKEAANSSLFTKKGNTSDITSTLVGEKMPYSLNLIHAIGEKPERCRASKLEPFTTIPWHHHHQTKYNHIVIHIPVQSNDDVIMAIKDNNDVVYEKKYKPGTVWLFNTFKNHAVFNKSSQVRYHLWLSHYLFNGSNILNHRLYDLIAKAVKSYDGPLMPENERPF